MSEIGPSLTKVIVEFIATQPASEQMALQQELFRFNRWFGPEREVQEITPMSLDNYREHLEASGVDTNRSLASLKALLTYAEEQKLLTNKLAKFVKMKRGGNRGKENLRQVEEKQRVMLTQEGLVNLRGELEYLIKEVRPQIAQALMEARADRDIRENAPFDAAKDYQAQVEARIRQLEQLLSSAEIIAASPSEKVILGSKVTIRDLASDEVVTFILVSTNEANPRLGRISIESPVGRALLDRREGDEVEVVVPAGNMRYRIERIEH